MLHIQSLTKRFGRQSIFENLSWHVGKGVRIGLVGPNGAGKTTLLRILAGIDSPDSGEVTSPRGTQIGYLPQEVETLEGATVLGQVLFGFAEVREIEEEIERIEAELAQRRDAHELDRLTHRYGDLRHRFEALGGYRLEGEARAILGGLGFPSESIHAPLATQSGGWRMRAALAGHLLRRPDLLLLDEPTNHLDLESLAWLEEFLDDYEGSIVIVSHDRFFLNRVVDGIAELEGGRLALYSGDYDDYLEDKEARQEALLAAKKNQDRQIAETERFIDRFRYKATKARQVQSRVKRLEKIARIRVHRGPKSIRFAFPQPPRSGAETIRVEGVRKVYGEKVVYEGADFVARRGDRIALVGPNGAGKTTLLKILAGTLAVDAGSRMPGHNVTLHYYAQHQLEALGAGRTVFEEIETVAPDSLRPKLRTTLGAFLFSGEDVDKMVGVLSGGEKARLALAKMLVRPASLLLLDEPTNHLDLRARGVLEEALDQYTGTIVFISHDRYFINRVATSVCEVRHGRLDLRPGSYDDYMDRQRGVAGAPPPAPEGRDPQPDRAARAAGIGESGAAGAHSEQGVARAGPGARASGGSAGAGGSGQRAGTFSNGPAPHHGPAPGKGGQGPARAEFQADEVGRRGAGSRGAERAHQAAGAARARAGDSAGAPRGGGRDGERGRSGAGGALSDSEPASGSDAVADQKRRDAGGKTREQKRTEAEDRQKRHRETKDFKERLALVEKEIAVLEARMKDVEAALADPALYRDGDRARSVSREHKEIQERIAWLYDEWAALEETLSKL